MARYSLFKEFADGLVDNFECFRCNLFSDDLLQTSTKFFPRSFFKQIVFWDTFPIALIIKNSK